MCAVVGIIGSRPETLGSNLSKMLQTNPWRGPDATGMWTQGGTGFGHHRLSIVDLDERANQPMQRGGYTLTFNGEIYNFKELKTELRDHWDFITSSDSEVILAAYQTWGKDCVKKFNGDWAFAIHDAQQNEVFLSRDRFGIKPLYYSLRDGAIVFASEVRAIRAIYPGDISDQNILTLLNGRRTEQINTTPFSHIHTVPPGHSVTIPIQRPSAYAVKRYYSENDVFRADVPRNFGDAVSAFGEIFEDAVRLRFLADVTVGVCLSGGLDSSLIVGALGRLGRGQNLHTFSGGALGYKGDESHYALMAARHVGTDHFPVALEACDIEDFLLPYTTAMDAPVGGLNTLGRAKVLREASQHVKVVLDGQGADEILCGYHRFHDLYREHVSGEFESRRTASNTRPASFKRRSLLNRERFSSLKPERPEKPEFDRVVDPVTKAQFMSLFGSGILSLLHTEDRFTMWNSIEGRVPFMDHRLVEFCMSCPVSYRIDDVEDKRLARAYARRHNIVPGAIIDRKDKLGFSTPYAQSPQIRDYLVRAARSALDEQPGLLSKAGVEDLIKLAEADMRLTPHLAHLVSFSKYMADLSV